MNRPHARHRDGGAPKHHQPVRALGDDHSRAGGHAAATQAKFQVPQAEQRDTVAFVQSLKKEIVEKQRR
jgi:hypothetical protein